MIRSVIALFVFAVILCGWIVLRDDPETPADVTRTTTADLTATPAPAPVTAKPTPSAPPKPSALRRRLAAEGRTTLHPPGTASTATVGDIQQAVNAAMRPQQPTEQSNAIAEAVRLAQANTSEGSSDTATNEFAKAILRARGLDKKASPKPEPKSLEDVVTQAMKQGQSDAYVRAMLEEAHKEGMIQPDAALTSEDGTLDTRTLLAQIVNRASTTTQTAPELRPEMIGGPGVEVRTVQRAEGTQTYTFYTVQSGDSLGFIAQKFYGDAAFYAKIWDANRAIISSPNRIRKGQRLVIPAL